MAKVNLNWDSLENYINRLKPNVQSEQVMKCEILGNNCLRWEKVMGHLSGGCLNLNNIHRFSPKEDDIPNIVESTMLVDCYLILRDTENLICWSGQLWSGSGPGVLSSFHHSDGHKWYFLEQSEKFFGEKILFLICVVNLEHARCAIRIETTFWDIL